MSLSIASHGGVVALGYDSATNERGFLQKMINQLKKGTYGKQTE